MPQPPTGYFEYSCDEACPGGVYSNLHLHDQECVDIDIFMPDLAMANSEEDLPDLDRAWLKTLHRDPLSFVSECASVADHSWIE